MAAEATAEATADAATRPLPDFSLRGVDRFDLFAGIAPLRSFAPLSVVESPAALFPAFVHQPVSDGTPPRQRRAHFQRSSDRERLITTETFSPRYTHATHRAIHVRVTRRRCVCVRAYDAHSVWLHSAARSRHPDEPWLLAAPSPLRPARTPSSTAADAAAASFELRAARLGFAYRVVATPADLFRSSVSPRLKSSRSTHHCARMYTAYFPIYACHFARL